jgi:hypothetical protein
MIASKMMKNSQTLSEKLLHGFITLCQYVQKFSTNIAYGIGFDEIPGLGYSLLKLGEKSILGKIASWILTQTFRYGDNFIVMWCSGGTPLGGLSGLASGDGFFRTF